MNHDYCHCTDYDADLCPTDCFRARLVKDYNERQKDFIGIPVSWSHLRVTNLCPLYKPKKTKADEIRAMNDEELANFLCNTSGMCAGCIAADFCKSGKNGFVEWLKLEVQSDT